MSCKYATMSSPLLCLVLLVATPIAGIAALSTWKPPPPTEWRKQAIYQVLTDRFARSDGGTERCTHFQKYCGGSFKGIANNIDYIKGMGFTAIWISPVQEQTKGLTWDFPEGYHGFWPKNLYEINQHFGGRQQLEEMLDELHKQGMMVMLDIVPNHMGYVQPADDFSSLVPFNNASFFHGCDGCGIFCSYIGTSDFSRERCRLSDLPDLAHELPAVRDMMVEWLLWMQQNFQFDAFRVDAASHMAKPFNQVLKNTSAVFTIGEYYMTRPYDQVAEWLADRLNSGALHSSLGITMMYAMREVFIAHTAPMSLLQYVRKQWQLYFPDKMQYIGMFIDSHDEPRFLCHMRDIPMYKNSLAFIFFTEGIPIVYYGMEQGMGGDRDPMWHAGYSTKAELYVYIKMLNWYRSSTELWDSSVTDVHADGDYYVFARGPFLLALSNRGAGASRATYTLENIPLRFAGMTLVNVLDTEDKLFVTADGHASWTTGNNGNPQIFFAGTPKPPAEFGPFEPKTWPANTDGVLLISCMVVAGAVAMAFGLALHWSSFVSGDTQKAINKQFDALGKRLYKLHAGTRRGMRMSLSSKFTEIVYDPESQADGEDDGVLTPGAPVVMEMRAGPLTTVGVVSARSSVDKSVVGERLLSEDNVSSAALKRSTSLRKSRVVKSASLQVKSVAPATLPFSQSVDVEAGRASHAREPFREYQSVHEFHRTGHLMTLATRRELTGALVSLDVDGSRVSGSTPGSELITPSSRQLLGRQFSRSGSPTASSSRAGPSAVHQPRGPSPLSPQTAARAWSASGAAPAKAAATGISPFAAPGAGMAASIIAAMADDSSLASSKGKPRHRLQPSMSDREIDYGAMLINEEQEQAAAQVQDSAQQQAAAPHRYHRTTDDSSEPAYSVPPTPGNQLAPELQAEHSFDSEAVAQVHPRQRKGKGLHVQISEASQEAAQHPAAAAAVAEEHTVPEDCILHVAMEYSIPHLSFNDQFIYGGLGKVVDVFLRCWSGNIALCCPLYRAAYEDDTATHPKFCDTPIATFTVTVGYKLHQVDIFRLQQGRVTYFLLQAEIFRMREKATIYTFSNEANMLTWLSVFSQAVSVVIRQYGVQQVQFHDYHGALSLLYLPPDEPVKVVYVAHNAHYNGVFLLPSKERRSYLYSMFDLNPELCEKATEHKTAFDILHSVVHYIRLNQRGFGIVGVSPRYAQEILAKQSVFWRLDSNQLQGITNALIENPNNLAARGLPLEQVLALKSAAKQAVQRQVGLTVGPQYQLVVFMGRMTHQKGCDIIAEAAKHFMAANPLAQLICIGPIGDMSGAKAQARLEDIAPLFPGRMWCPRNQYVQGELREQLWHGCDWCLCPSRFEPCGLVDIEFGWNGALIVGHNTGGLGKMPGVYFTAESSRLAHLAAKLETVLQEALQMMQQEKEKMIQDAMARKFPTDMMMAKYKRVWDTVDNAVDAEAREEAREQTKQLQQFFDDKWKKHNIQDPDANQDDGSDGLPLMTILGTSLPLPAHQDVSNVLLLGLQSATMLPSLLLLSFVIWSEFYSVSISMCRAGIDDSSSVFSGVLSGLTLRAVMFFGVGTTLGPLWSFLVFRMRPLSYIRMVVVLLVLQLVVAMVCLWQSQVVNVGLILTSACALSGNPLMALGYLGKETTTEVAEVGMVLMGITECVRALMLMLTALLAAVATAKTTFLGTAGAMLILSTLLAVWFFWDPALPSEYRHIKLLAKGTTKMLRGVWSFYLTIVICALDLFATSLIGYLCLLQWQLHFFTQLYALLYGVAAASVVLLVCGLSMRWAQLHIHKWLLAVASLPGYGVLMALVIWKMEDRAALMAAAAVLQLLLGERQHVVGLLGFQTLPSREAVAVWQLLVVGCSCLLALLVAVAGSQLGLMVVVPSAPGITMVLGVVEVARAICAVLLVKRHGQEDLTSL